VVAGWRKKVQAWLSEAVRDSGSLCAVTDGSNLFLALRGMLRRRAFLATSRHC
jgi:hypothetical protein